MARTTFVTERPVTLEGYQAVMKPSKFGYSMSALIDQDLIDKLEEDRIETLKWAESKLKNPKRSVCKPEPWEEVADGQYKVKFSWNEDLKPPVVDTEGVLLSLTLIYLSTVEHKLSLRSIRNLTSSRMVSRMVHPSNAKPSRLLH